MIAKVRRGSWRRTICRREFGATDVVEERGDAAAERIKEMTRGVGAEDAITCHVTVRRRPKADKG